MTISESNTLEDKIINYIKYNVLSYPDDIKLKRFSFNTFNDKIRITFYYPDDKKNDGWFIGQEIYLCYSDIIQFDRMNKMKQILC